MITKHCEGRTGTEKFQVKAASCRTRLCGEGARYSNVTIGLIAVIRTPFAVNQEGSIVAQRILNAYVMLTNVCHELRIVK